MDGWIKKMWYTHSRKLFSHTKNEILPFVTTWMTLSKTNQKQKDNYCTISLIGGIIWEKERE